jgi:hypothetical protein
MLIEGGWNNEKLAILSGPRETGRKGVISPTCYKRLGRESYGRSSTAFPSSIRIHIDSVIKTTYIAPFPTASDSVEDAGQYPRL